MAFSADNRQIVSGSRDRSIKLWNTLAQCKYTITVGFDFTVFHSFTLGTKVYQFLHLFIYLISTQTGGFLDTIPPPPQKKVSVITNSTQVAEMCST